LCGFTYQTFELVLQYTRGLTVVNIEVKRLDFSPLPAITFCLPFFATMENLLKFYPELKQDFDIYKNISYKMNRISDLMKENFENISEQMRHKYVNYTVKVFESMTILEAFKQISLPIGDHLRAFVMGREYNKYGTINKISSFPDIDPIESIKQNLMV